jgi:enamine deaminase RidA (YjgF/YER057c/UK114 family)
MELVGDLALLTWVAEGDASGAASEAERAYRAFDETLRTSGGVVLQERIFGGLSTAGDVLAARRRATAGSGDAWAVPPTHVEGDPVSGDGRLAGIHLLAVRCESSRLVRDGAHVVGRIAEVRGVHLLGLSDVGRVSAAPNGPNAVTETAAAIEATERVLGAQGFSYRDVVRTWYYLRDILGWYGPFNGVRNAAFRRMGLIGPHGDGAVPASTGIGGRGARGNWCTLDLIAARAVGGGAARMTRLHNRRQNEATEYGSAFARGMALTLGEHRYLFISGTASIDDHGATVFRGDFEAQATQTVEAIGALLESAGATLGDIRQATTFIKRPGDRKTYDRLTGRAPLNRVPAIIVETDACRDDLLIEIDATAVVPATAGGSLP